jgi:recombination protein RecA
VPSIEDIIKKEFGDNILISANRIVDRKKTVIPVSPAIDMILSGGLTSGITSISGKPKSGKTSLSLYFAANAQKEEYGGRDIFFYNIEARLKKRDLSCVPGLNLDKFFVIESNEDKILSCADFLEIADKLITIKKGSVHIFDSFSALSTDQELTEGMSKALMDTGNKTLAKFCRKTASKININDIFIIGLQHLAVNLSGYGSLLIEKSATAVKHQADNKLICKSFAPWKIPKTSDNIVGQIIHWTCECSSIGPPFKSADGYLVYGKSISKEMELVNIAKDINLIDATGAWYTMTFLEDSPKFHGEENCRAYLVDNPDKCELLNNLVRERLGLPKCI